MPEDTEELHKFAMPTVSAPSPTTSTHSCVHQVSLLEKSLQEQKRMAEGGRVCSFCLYGAAIDAVWQHKA